MATVTFVYFNLPPEWLVTPGAFARHEGWITGTASALAFGAATISVASAGLAALSKTGFVAWLARKFSSPGAAEPAG
jgi:hypothetical protein